MLLFNICCTRGPSTQDKCILLELFVCTALQTCKLVSAMWYEVVWIQNLSVQQTMHPLTAVPYWKDVEMTCVVRCRPSSYIIITFLDTQNCFWYVDCTLEAAFLCIKASDYDWCISAGDECDTSDCCVRFCTLMRSKMSPSFHVIIRYLVFRWWCHK